jgi:ribonuclease T
VISTHVQPFEGSELDPRSLEITGIDVDHPFRMALPEREALDHIFKPIRKAVREAGCSRRPAPMASNAGGPPKPIPTQR